MSYPPVEKTKERPEPIKFGNEKYSDVTLFVEDQDFLVHRMVLAAHSDVFGAMLLGDFKEAKEDRVEIKGVSIDLCKKILEIMYYGRMSECEALQFPIHISTLQLANDYKACYHFGFSSVSDSKALYQMFWNFVNELLAVADCFNITDLALKCLQEEITKNFCQHLDCCICLNLYMFAFVKKMPILDRFHSFTYANFRLWQAAVFTKDAPMWSPMLTLDQITIFLDKFSVPSNFVFV